MDLAPGEVQYVDNLIEEFKQHFIEGKVIDEQILIINSSLMMRCPSYDVIDSINNCTHIN